MTYYISKHSLNFDVEYPNNFGLTFAIFLSFASLFQKGTSGEPNMVSTRIATVTTFFATLIVYVAYSAALISFLTVFKITLPFDDLASMYHGTDFKFGSIKGTSFEDLFENGNAFYRKLYEERYEFVNSFEEGIQKSLNEDFAFIWDTDVMENLVGQKCSHVAIPQSTADFVVGFLMKKNHPYKDMFNYFLFKLEESGQLSRMWSVWRATPREDCFDNETIGLGIHNVVMAFFILVCAMMLSFLIVLGECTLRLYVEYLSI